jgi:hypothetical protein
VPTPSAEAIAQNKEEEAGRREQGRMAQIMGNFKMHPSVSMAAKAGEPSMEDPQPTNATQVMKDLNSALEPPKNAATVETVGKGEERPNDPAPRSDSGQATPTDPKADSNSPTQDPNAAQQPATPPTQVNEAAASSDTKTNDSSATSSSSTQSKDDKKKDESSSKKKKKKKLGIF